MENITSKNRCRIQRIAHFYRFCLSGHGTLSKQKWRCLADQSIRPSVFVHLPVTVVIMIISKLNLSHRARCAIFNDPNYKINAKCPMICLKSGCQPVISKNLFPSNKRFILQKINISLEPKSLFMNNKEKKKPKIYGNTLCIEYIVQ